MIWRRRPGSPLSAAGTAGSIQKPSFMARNRATALNMSTAVSSISRGWKSIFSNSSLPAFNLEKSRTSLTRDSKVSVLLRTFLQHVALVGIERAIGQQPAEADNRVERSANFVADVGHELGLKPCRIQRGVARFPQILFQTLALRDITVALTTITGAPSRSWLALRDIAGLTTITGARQGRRRAFSRASQMCHWPASSTIRNSHWEVPFIITSAWVRRAISTSSGWTKAMPVMPI